jgi:hypothetical protein
MPPFDLTEFEKQLQAGANNEDTDHQGDGHAMTRGPAAAA